MKTFLGGTHWALMQKDLFLCNCHKTCQLSATKCTYYTVSKPLRVKAFDTAVPCGVTVTIHGKPIFEDWLSSRKFFMMVGNLLSCNFLLLCKFLNCFLTNFSFFFGGGGKSLWDGGNHGGKPEQRIQNRAA